MKASWVPGRVLDASDRSYLSSVLPLLEKAEKEIVVSLYLMEPDDTGAPEHPVNRLMEALLGARRRGVRVRIFLNSRFRVRSKAGVAHGKYFDRLLEAGAELAVLLPARRLHDKLIVIDGRYVVEGSTNWSQSALHVNFESSSVVDSPAHARKKLERIEMMMRPPAERKRETDRPLLPLPETIEIPVRLFEPSGFPSMVRTSDGRSLTLYLVLLGQAAAIGSRDLEVDLETLGQALRLPSDWDRARMRRQVIKVLRKLQNRYQLIQVEWLFARDARVRLQEFPGEKFRVSGQVLASASLPRKSSGTAFLTLARELLKREGIDMDSLSAPELEKRFGVGAGTARHARRVGKSSAGIGRVP